MKKILILGAILMLLLPLAACSGGSEADGDISPFQEGEATENEFPPISAMLFGTLSLEGTDLAVGSEMASALRPLWQAARTIFTSDMSAVEERDAILNQIGEAMTAEQVAAILAMDLTAEDTRGMLRELLGDEFQAGSMPGAEGSESPFGRRGQGQGLPGIVPGEGLGGPGFSQEMDPEAHATAQALRAERGERLVNPMLFEIIIELLQARASE